MSENFTIEIISPEKSIIKSSTTEVVIPSYEGEMGILKDHVPLITFLRPGVITIINVADKKKFFVEEGTVEFSNNNLLILTSKAKELNDFNAELLEKSINEAEKKISNDAISDKEKYLLSYKIETLKNIKQ
tara:strand:+ start:796 stop:1188 length:393 start_codon:yes stop_codon:yes gene_type:complete